VEGGIRDVSRTLVSINTFNNGSTGHIMRNVREGIRGQGWKAYCAYGRYNEQAIDSGHDIIIGKKKDVYLHYLYAKLTNKRGLGPASRAVTKKLMRRLDEIKPSLIHLHNLHGYYLNIEILFDYLKQSGIPVVWTLHDCWAFTGHCGHFDAAGCEKWRKGCFKCSQIRTTGSKGFIDNSKWNWQRKRELFTSLPEKQLTLITPSKWLAELVGQSFLSDYPLRVINNGIDTGVFRPRSSNFRARYHLEDKTLLLGVASTWEERKGFYRFIELSHNLPCDQVIVLVGLSKKQLVHLPKNILGLSRTDSLEELAEIYSTSDIYINMSSQEVMGLTTIEALACGTPALVLDSTALPEFVDNKITGFTFKQAESEVLHSIEELLGHTPSSHECVKYASRYSSESMAKQYLECYSSMVD